ncbi:NUDIX domain-containing protein [Desulfamplus magnetovallimortis]|uniref:NUDIX domain-containing protein n=1 Tax=Desulfamplus magnetovallimortis TaxID=1246637 RepID=UPI0009BA94B6|nr:NUDIX domain-containing protein [Desulfamplus magnetovallimortis]
MIRNENCVLLTRRKKGQMLEGYWEFPGGKIEKDETPQSCLEIYLKIGYLRNIIFEK